MHSVIATQADGKDPLFVNFALNSVPLTSYTYNQQWDLHLSAGSPALQGAYTGTDLDGHFCTTGLSVGGNNYKTALAQPYFGACGKL